MALMDIKGLRDKYMHSSDQERAEPAKKVRIQEFVRKCSSEAHVA